MRRILSLDGGGIRGVIAAAILARLEDTVIRMPDMSEHGTHVITGAFEKKRRVSRIFDLIAGTSTGGLLACALTVPKNEHFPDQPRYSAKWVGAQYMKRADVIFNSNFIRRNVGTLWLGKYSRDGLDSVVEDIIGDTHFSDSTTRVMVPSWNLSMGCEKFWKSWRSDVGMRDVAISTASAPTYFDPYNFEGVDYVDGGVFANNPTAFAIAEAKRLWPGEPISVVSIGTSGDVPAIDLSSSGYIGWLKGGNIIKVMLESGQISHETLSSILMADAPERYVRIAPNPLGIEMDTSDPESLLRLRLEGERLAEKHMPAIVRALSA